MKKNILIIGSIADRNLIRLVNSIIDCDTNNQICIDILHINPPKHNSINYRISELTSKVGKIYFVKDQNNYGSLFNKFVRVTKIYSSLKQIEKYYDLVNIHFMSGFYFFLWPLIKKKGRKILITPWGSDVYRVNKLAMILIGYCYKYTDYVSFGSKKLKQDIKNMFGVPERKFVDLAFGSKMIDLISNSNNISKNAAKKELNLVDKYVIICGYNASPAQQHLVIIESLTKIKDSLPTNTILLFLMTYAKNVDYIKEVKIFLQSTDFDYMIYEDYLTDDQLLNIRKAADLFIHVQHTDAFSASLQEYILCDTKIVNGSWLIYPELEKFGYPYYVTKSISNLGEIVKEAIEDDIGIVISEDVKQFIRERGYDYQARKWLGFYSNPT